MFFTLITTVLAGEPQALADLTELTTGYGTALSRVVNDPDWTEESLESLVTDPDWRYAFDDPTSKPNAKRLQEFLKMKENIGDAKPW